MAKSKYQDILTKEYLMEQHVELGRSPLSISNEIGCDRKTVIWYLHYYEIPYVSHQYPSRKMKDHSRWKGYGDISHTQYMNIATNAKNRGIEFDITIEELWDQYLIQDKKCYYTGREIGFVHNRKGNASLDRTDSSLPYTKDNVKWVHKDVNLAKQSLTESEFLSLCKEIVSNRNV